MDVQLECTTEGTSYYVAEVRRAGELMCRVSVVGLPEEDAAARKVLASKARAWIDEYVTRHASDNVAPPSLEGSSS